MGWRVRKGVTVGLLIYALLDVCVPGLCPYPLPVPPATSCTLRSAHTQGNPASPLDDTDEETCFCCSGQAIVVAPRVYRDELLISVIHFESVSLPMSPSISPPHQPPRF